jgi:hypothetical protein
MWKTQAKRQRSVTTTTNEKEIPDKIHNESTTRSNAEIVTYRGVNLLTPQNQAIAD